MPNVRIVISAPIDDNLYSLLVSQLCIDEVGVDVCGVLTLKVLSMKRIRSEFRRLGGSLIKKIWKKYFRENNCANEEDVLAKASLVDQVGLRFGSLKDIASQYRIPYAKVESPNDQVAIEFLKNQNPDIVLSIGSAILREPFIKIPTLGVFNVHMGILPEYRGIGVTEWPIIEGRLDDVGVGVTLHIIEKGVDTGPIILKKKIDISHCGSLGSLEAKYLKEMVELMVRGVRMARDGRLISTRQKECSGRQYFSTHKRMKDLAEKKISSSLKV